MFVYAGYGSFELSGRSVFEMLNRRFVAEMGRYLYIAVVLMMNHSSKRIIQVLVYF